MVTIIRKIIMTSELFNPKTITRQCSDVVFTESQKMFAIEWLDMLESGKLERETPNYYNFIDKILVGVLKYDKGRIKHHEDNIEFQVTDKSGNKVLCIEAKGSAADLYKYQRYGKEDKKTPILQTWSYMGMDGRKYGICTNYNKFILITKIGGYEKQYVFDFESIRNDHQLLKEFIYVFSMNTLIDGKSCEDLREASNVEQRDFTEKFYNLFHDTRVMMVHEFEKEPEVTRTEAIYYAQIILNRLIFIFFVADRGVVRDSTLFADIIKKQLDMGDFTEYSHRIYDSIVELFTAFDKGSRIRGINNFNGSLFSGQLPSKIRFLDVVEKTKSSKKIGVKLPKPDRTVSSIMNEHPALNPIVVNLLMMDQYDFNTEVDVSILGHIFEQSLADIETLKEKKDDKRKNEGIYYTPEYITEYICKNTIVPFLSKSGTSSIQKLLEEYMDDLETLEGRIRRIRILDPACGSGAFLIKAIDLLMIIIKAIRKIQASYAADVQKTMEHTVEDEMELRRIITESIYGVDLNRESVDITKLSLFLKMVTDGHQLTSLSKNIKHGNSLISDPDMTDMFDWKSEFPEMMKSGGFDIIVGNPPYGAALSKKERAYFNKQFQIGSTDTAQLMIKRSFDLLKNDGYHSFIVPKALIYASNWIGIRNLIKQQMKILLDVGKVWKEVKLEQVIYTVQKKYVSSYLNGVRDGEYLHAKHIVDKQYTDLFGFFPSGMSEEEMTLGRKIYENSDKLGEFVTNRRGSGYQSHVRKDGDVDVLGGKQIQSFHIDGTYGKMKRSKHLYDNAHVHKDSVLAQNIVAHITKPTEHIKIISTIPTNRNFVILDTVNQICPTNSSITAEYLLGLLSSKIVNWYVYRFIYGKAIRTMHFDSPVTNRIPIVADRVEEISDYVKELVKLNEKLYSDKQTHAETLDIMFGVKSASEEIIKLENIEFDTFCNKIPKLGGKKPSLRDIGKWKTYFTNTKESLTRTTNNMYELENKLNDAFYKIFGLTKSEVKLIEPFY